METFRLAREGTSDWDEWVLEWNDETLTLTTPDGEQLVEIPPADAHRLFELFELYSEGKVSVSTTSGSLTFKKHPSAVSAVRGLVEAGMAGDPDFCIGLRRQSLFIITLGLIIFVVGGGLSGLYCWYASTVPDPPPDHWIRAFGGLIHSGLVILIGMGLAGSLMAWFGLRQWLRVRQIDGLADEGRSGRMPSP